MLFKISPFTVPLRKSAIAAPRKTMGEAANAHTAHLNILKGGRCAIVCETAENDELKTSVIKNLSDGSRMAIRGLGKEEEEMISHCKVIIHTNKTIQYQVEQALTDRLKYLEFSQQFVDHPTKPHHVQKDKQKVKNKLENMNDILAWLLEGSIRYYNEGIVEPEQVIQMSCSQQKEADPATYFLSEYLLQEPNGKVWMKDLFEAYQNVEQDYDMTMRTFIKQVRQFTGEECVRKCNGNNRLVGYRLIDPSSSFDFPENIK